LGIAEDVEDRLARAEQVKVCKFAQLLESLPESERGALVLAVDRARAEESLPQTQRVFTKQFVVDLCVNNGHKIGKTVVSEHLRKVCTCDD
jgi:hypothetical protein